MAHLVLIVSSSSFIFCNTTYLSIDLFKHAHRTGTIVVEQGSLNLSVALIWPVARFYLAL